MWTAFINLLFEILLWIYKGVGDWGLAIIVFTVASRLLMTPLMIQQIRSTHKIQKIQPFVKELQEKYKDDKEMLNQKTMELYAEHNINLLSGCLPMLLQTPLFMALYQMLAAPIAGKNPGGPFAQHLGSSVGSFYGLIPNLMMSSKEVFNTHNWVVFIPYLVLLIFFGASMYVPQMMTPGTDNNQKMMTLAMSGVLLLIGWSAPAGVLLYWDTSSLIGIGQQWFTQRSLQKATESTPEITVEKPKAKSSQPKSNTPVAPAKKEGATAKKNGKSKK